VRVAAGEGAAAQQHGARVAQIDVVHGGRRDRGGRRHAQRAGVQVAVSPRNDCDPHARGRRAQLDDAGGRSREPPARRAGRECDEAHTLPRRRPLVHCAVPRRAVGLPQRGAQGAEPRGGGAGGGAGACDGVAKDVDIFDLALALGRCQVPPLRPSCRRAAPRVSAARADGRGMRGGAPGAVTGAVTRR